ncbi:phage tail protein [Shewanella oncorhynchi]|uniref:phage tail protein n=1 Tax=Shewanella oncorhynchi TaxID=2726434 RepID=UPI003D7A2A19
MSQFFTILTRSGAAALANGMALGQAVHITSFQVGDGGGAAYEPTLEQLKASTALVNPVYTGAINELKQDPENPARYYIEGVVPVNKGGWTVREVGWFLENGEMFAVTKFPPSYKSVPADGAATELPIRTYLAIGSDANVTLKIDPTVVLATREFVEVRNRLFRSSLLLSDDNRVEVGRRHRFMKHSSQLLPVVSDGETVVFHVDFNVELDSGDCRLVAPAGEKIVMFDGEHDELLIKAKGVDFILERINGRWRV